MRDRGMVVNLRQTLIERDGYVCRYCGKILYRWTQDAADRLRRRGRDRPKDWPTIDRVIPLSRGGTWELANMVIACHRCNQRKGDKMLHETGMRLRGIPELAVRVRA